MESEGVLRRPADAAQLAPGLVIGRCRVIRLIAAGGQGSIYLAHHQALDKDVALKVLPPSLSNDEEFVRRFLREARSAARLEHPNIVQVYDAGIEKDIHYIVMQYVDGRDLQRLLDRRGKITVNDALAITRRVAIALASAHKAGILHRDIKPSNIMLTRQGRVMVTDFGLARDMSATMSGVITQSGFVMGTPDFLSPEQAMGERLDPRSDIYSLGATLYSMLAGRPPYADENPVQVLMKHVRENERPAPLPTVNPEATPAVEALVAKMMAKSPHQRYASMEEVVAAIDAIKGGSRAAPSVEPEPVPAPRHWKWTRWAIAAGIAIVVALIVLLRPDPAERAWRSARAAEDRARQDPSLLPEAIELHRAITTLYPKSPQAERSTRRMLDLIERAGPSQPFAQSLRQVREILARTPPPPIPSRASEVLTTLSRWEIAARSEKLARAARQDRWDEALQLVLPARINTRSKEDLRKLLGLDAAGTQIRLHPERMIVDVERGEAHVPFASTPNDAPPREDTLHWKLVGDGWCLVP
ncbi:MAG: protein kinase [Planctomycetes bacterium]|nr:protein kinase [Planctomycetota bacterium]